MKQDEPLSFIIGYRLSPTHSLSCPIRDLRKQIFARHSRPLLVANSIEGSRFYNTLFRLVVNPSLSFHCCFSTTPPNCTLAMDARLRRLNKEIADCKNDRSSRITIDLVDNSPYHLIGAFDGPEGTPYEGGHFQVDIVIPDSYPFQPVKMKFITKVYHPNVSSASGAICLDILKDAWSPVLTLKSTLISLQSLLCSPEPRDPQDAEVAKHYMTSKSSFEDTARYWTHIFAGGPGREGSGKTKADAAKDDVAMAGLDRAHVDRFQAIGFERSKVVRIVDLSSTTARLICASMPLSRSRCCDA
ncbi:hypothetical protein AcW2_007754 [Taiwanofungus camphoratus]|nr:hypothetical protein AcW2_007754 [Antrodia cinnamomea]